MRLIKLISLLLILSTIFSCTSLSKPDNTNSQTLPIACKQMVPIKDIWSLEPMLLKSGKIQERMTKIEKEKIIRQYIQNKNAEYKTCLKSSK